MNFRDIHELKDANRAAGLPDKHPAAVPAQRENPMPINTLSQFPANVRRHVGQAYAAMLRKEFAVAAEHFNEAQLECLARATATTPTVPPPGTLYSDYLALAERATDPGARAHWQRLAEDELEEARRHA